MQLQSLGWEDPLEQEMATHSSILAWRIPWTVEPSGLQSMGSQKSWTQLETKQQQLNILARILKRISDMQCYCTSQGIQYNETPLVLHRLLVLLFSF